MKHVAEESIGGIIHFYTKEATQGPPNGHFIQFAGGTEGLACDIPVAWLSEKEIKKSKTTRILRSKRNRILPSILRHQRRRNRKNGKPNRKNIHRNIQPTRKLRCNHQIPNRPKNRNQNIPGRQRRKNKLDKRIPTKKTKNILKNKKSC